QPNLDTQRAALKAAKAIAENNKLDFVELNYEQMPRHQPEIQFMAPSPFNGQNETKKRPRTPEEKQERKRRIIMAAVESVDHQMMKEPPTKPGPITGQTSYKIAKIGTAGSSKQPDSLIHATPEPTRHT